MDTLKDYLREVIPYSVVRDRIAYIVLMRKTRIDVGDACASSSFNTDAFHLMAQIDTSIVPSFFIFSKQ